MNRIHYIFLALSLVVAAITIGQNPLHAQSAITIAGGDATSASGSIAYSCGEVAVKSSLKKAITVVNITVSYNEGVQSPFTERDKQDQYNGIQPLSIKLDVYPTVTNEGVTIEGENTEPLYFTLYNTNGLQLQQGTYNGGQYKLDLSGYASGNYLLRVASGDKKEINTYKIILLR